MNEGLPAPAAGFGCDRPGGGLPTTPFLAAPPRPPPPVPSTGPACGLVPAVMVAIELGKAEPPVERQRRRIAGFNLETGAGGPLGPRPGGEAGDNPAGIAAAAPARIGDKRLVAQEPAMDGAIAERRDLALGAQCGKGRRNGQHADDPAVGGR